MVGDNFDDLVIIFCECSQYVDVLIVNGGLGLISDDLSVFVVAIAKGEGLVLYEVWFKEMECYFYECG